MRSVVFVALGSNLGDRRAYLSAARNALSMLSGTALLAASVVEETAPLGMMPQGPYLNQMVAIDTTLSPLALLDRLHGIEQALGRIRTVRWGPRTIDLDIVHFGATRSSTIALTLPHPAIDARDFWRREAAELRDLLSA